MNPEHEGLSKLFAVSNSLDYFDGIVETGFALPASNAEKFLEGVKSLAESLGGVCYADLSFGEFDKIVDAAILQRDLENRGLHVVSKPKSS